MTTPKIAAVLSGVLLLVTGCAQSSAKSAVDRARSALDDIRAEAEKVAPDEFAALNDSLASMQARIDSGDYSSALMGARTLTSSARDLGANLEGRKGQLTTAYNSAAAEIPGLLEAVTKRIGELSAMRRLPAGVNAQAFTAVRDEAPQWASQWSEVTAAFGEGKVAEALSAANRLRTRLTQAAAALGVAAG